MTEPQGAVPPVVLAIGGSDSGGNYGLQADLRTFAALGVHATTAVTIVTAQNTTGIRQAFPLPVDAVVAQLEAVLADLQVAAVKTGMLGRVEIVDAVADLAAAGRLPNLVVDPVLVDRHGRPPFGPEVTDAYLRRLLPHAVLVTPNRDELSVLLGRPIASEDDLVTGATDLGPSVLATGGRLGGDEVVDVLRHGGLVRRFRAPRVATDNVAGTGDCVSAAVTAGLAHGRPLEAAVGEAVDLVRRAIARSATWHLGLGPGPIDVTGAARAAAVAG